MDKLYLNYIYQLPNHKPNSYTLVLISNIFSLLIVLASATPGKGLPSESVREREVREYYEDV